MASVSWPSALPPPEVNGYAFEHGDAVVLFEPEVGPPKARPRGAVAADRIRMSLLLDSDGRDLFRTFYRATTRRGTVPFEMADPATGEIGDWLFAGPPREQPLVGGRFWRIAFQLVRVA